MLMQLFYRWDSSHIICIITYIQYSLHFNSNVWTLIQLSAECSKDRKLWKNHPVATLLAFESKHSNLNEETFQTSTLSKKKSWDKCCQSDLITEAQRSPFTFKFFASCLFISRHIFLFHLPRSVWTDSLFWSQPQVATRGERQFFGILVLGFIFQLQRSNMLIKSILI